MKSAIAAEVSQRFLPGKEPNLNGGVTGGYIKKGIWQKDIFLDSKHSAGCPMFTAFLFWVLIVLSPKHIRFNGVPPAGSQQADSPHADSGYAAFVFPQPHSAAAHSVRPTRLWIFAFSPVLPPLSRASRKRT